MSRKCYKTCIPLKKYLNYKTLNDGTSTTKTYLNLPPTGDRLVTRHETSQTPTKYRDIYSSNTMNIEYSG